MAVAVTTSDRLIAAATELFARHGFHGTSIRDIAARAGANVAAGHYHYGSKEGLYLQVLRAQFAAVRARLERRGATRAAPALRDATPRELTRLLEARIITMLEVLLRGPHGALMQREMCDPTDALPVIVNEFIRPQVEEMETIVSHLAPGMPRPTIRRAVFSIVGQVLFYRFTLPALLLLEGKADHPRGFALRIARHITAFSLGGLARMTHVSTAQDDRTAARAGRRHRSGSRREAGRAR